jgi:hypothetical protein
MNFHYRREDRKKWMAGGVLLVLSGVMLYRSVGGGAPSAAPAPAAAARTSGAFGALDIAMPATRGRVAPGSRARGTAAAATAAPAEVLDPKLRLDVLNRVQAITYQGSERNIFQYYTPPPKIETPKSDPLKPPGAADKSGPPPPAPPPPIPLKYYGYAEKPMGGPKKAFFSDGDEIYIASEGDIVAKKYKIVKIGVNTVEAEDIATKNRQVLPLQEQTQ